MYRFLTPIPRFGSARLAQIQPTALVYSKKSGGRRTMPSSGSVRVPLSTAVRLGPSTHTP